MKGFDKYTVVMRSRLEPFGNKYSESEQRAKAATAAVEKPDVEVANAPDEPVVAGVDVMAQSDGVGKEVFGTEKAGTNVVSGVDVPGIWTRFERGFAV